MNFVENVKNFMLKGLTPKGIAKKLAGDNPILNNLVSMAENGDEKGIEKFAMNVMKEQGMDFEKEFTEFMKNFNW